MWLIGTSAIEGDGNLCGMRVSLGYGPITHPGPSDMRKVLWREIYGLNFYPNLYPATDPFTCSAAEWNKLSELSVIYTSVKLT